MAALEGLGPTLHLNAEALDRMMSHPGTAQTDPSDSTDIALAGWLNQQAARYRYVVFEAITAGRIGPGAASATRTA